MEYFIFIVLVALAVFFYNADKKKSEEDNMSYNMKTSDIYVPEGYELKKKKNRGCVFYIVLMLVTITAIYYITNKFDKDDREFRDKYGIEEIRHGSDKDKLEAYGYVENFVKNKLKSPSSAVFPSYREQIEHTDYLGEDVFKIKSWVDSQNGFGAMIRTRFVCTIYYQDNKVKCQDLQFLE
jgi:hypothetical protein